MHAPRTFLIRVCDTMTEMWRETDMINLSFRGRFDSTNAQEYGRRISDAVRNHPGQSVILDFDGVEYISSSGLRVLLNAQKQTENRITVKNVSPGVYEIMDITGFTSILNVERKLREMDVTGCEVIGRGGVSTVYRVDRETIVKVYEIPDALDIIRNEQRRAKQALLRGIPTAISYDAVRVGDRYGSVFELVNARTFVELLADEPDRLDELVRLHVDVIRQVHSVETEPGELPDCREVYLKYLDQIGDEIPGELSARLREMFSSMPYDPHMIHGDIHMKNVMLCDGEPLLIDMDTLSCGNPVFDLSDLFIAYRAFNEDDPTNSQRVIGLPADLCACLWEKTVACYLDKATEEELRQAEKKMMAVGYVRFLYLVAGLNLGGGELRPVRIRHAAGHLQELLESVDSFVL